MTDTRALALLFTDLVGSTSLASSVGPVVAEELRREHFALMRESIAETGGDEIKNLGDGLMVAYGSASRAVQAAVDMQQRLEQRNRGADEQLAIRIGVAAGEAERAEDDWFGPPVVEAARLCATAGGGQILVGALAQALAAGRGEVTFEPVGPLELKGLPAPVEAFEVPWEPLGDTVAAVPLPPRLRGVPHVAYVGRVAERRRLADVWAAALDGSPRIVFVAGEPGIGKTRLATHTALDLHAQGATVLYGHCEEDLAVPYTPWIQVVGHLVEHLSQDVLDAHVLRHGGELLRLAPALRLRVAAVPEPTTTDPETERYLLFAAVNALLDAARAERPTVLVLDDLHWADKPSLVLLKHVLGESATPGLLVLGTYRDSELGQVHPLGDLLAQLPSLTTPERIALAGLDPAEVAEIMTAAAGHALQEDGLGLAAQIAAETGGNAFYVGEMLRHLNESGALVLGSDGRWEIAGGLEELGLPQSVRDVIGRRVGRLGEPVAAVLRLAAVIGRDFDVELLARAARQDEDEILNQLDVAATAAVIVERSRPGTFSFAHALINHTLYEEIGATRRARLHLQVAEALEQICGDDPADRVAELARHWTAASLPVDAAKAVGYSRQAGERALAALAPDEALRWFGQALALLGAAEGVEPRERCRVLVGLGTAQYQTGDPAHRETLLEAAGLAYELRDADLAAAAVLAFTDSQYSIIGDIDHQRVEAVERALELDGGRDPARRARLLARLAFELGWDFDFARRRALIAEALEIARSAGDRAALAEVLVNANQADWSPDRLAEQLPTLDEELAAAHDAGDPGLLLAAHLHKMNAAILCGDMATADTEGRAAETLGADLKNPALIWLVKYTGRDPFLIQRIHMREAAAVVEASLALGQSAGRADAPLIYAGQMSFVWLWSGQVDEALGIVRQAVELYPRMEVWRAGLATIAAWSDRQDEARGILDAALDGFASVARDFTLATTLGLYADAAFATNHVVAAERLLEVLEPLAHLVVWSGTQIYGHGRMYRGMLAAVCGRHAEADADLEFACRWHEDNELMIWAARSRLALAESLARRGEHERAADLARGVLGFVARLGYEGLRPSAEALLGRAGVPTTAHGGLTH